MSKKFYVFASDINDSSPLEPSIILTHDSGFGAVAIPATDPTGRKGQLIEIPDSVPDSNGCQLDLDLDGYTPLKMRGLLKYSGTDRAYLQCDDFRMVKIPDTTQPEPPPPQGSDPLDFINAVYASGQYNLATKTGCGTFTEACCTSLALNLGTQWGHVAKSPGQNQYNNHAVDAVHCLFGEYCGIWDIITSSVSSSAKPAFNDAGSVNPEIWRPYTPVPVQPVTASFVVVKGTVKR